MRKLLIATTKKGKLEEFREILKYLELKLLTLKDINFPKIEPAETGKTFAENAKIKAKFYGQKTGLLTLADDTGLIVTALPHLLGLNTKRYASGSDEKRNQKLLQKMKNIPINKRGAYFISVVCLFDPNHHILKIAQGKCEGRIAFEPKGKCGFGYDPIFIVNNLHKYFAELSLKEKNLVSHRAKALHKIKKYLLKHEN